jgi:PASTA domain
MNTLKALILVLGLAVTLAAPGSALAAAPANDDLADAAELTGRVVFAEGTNEEADKQAGEPNHAGNAGGASIWYRWRAPAAGKATVSTCGSELNTLLAVYTGDAFPLAPVAENDDSCGQQSRLTFEATEGTTYRIAVDGFDGDTGSVFLSLSLAPPNDAFADAQTLTGDSGSATGTTIGASTEDAEPAHAGVGWSSVWFEWTAPSSGWANFETCGSPFDTVLGVYTGSELSGLSTVTANDDSCELGSRVSFSASAGTVYAIALAGYDGETGEFTLSWNRNPPPPIVMQFPAISGLARDGETLTASDGQWAGDGPFTYAYAWLRCDPEDEECDFIPGAVSRTFTLGSADVRYQLMVRVTATNAVGSTAAFSDTTAVVAARPPSNTTQPSISGGARLGALLVASPGAWIGTPPLSLAYQWQRCNASGSACGELAGQTGQVMRVTRGVLGARLRVVVTATNSAGSVSAPSVATPLVRVTRARRCVVPNVRGRTLRAARTAIARRGCRVGRIRRAFSTRARAGRVLAQTPRAGVRRAFRARVHLVVSRGRRR